MSNQLSKKSRVLEGKVVSDKMDKTIVVSVTRMFKHPKYGKYIRLSKKYKVHDPLNSHKVGDLVSIKETKPLSKDKSFVVA